MLKPLVAIIFVGSADLATAQVAACWGGANGVSWVSDVFTKSLAEQVSPEGVEFLGRDFLQYVDGYLGGDTTGFFAFNCRYFPDRANAQDHLSDYLSMERARGNEVKVTGWRP